MLGSLALVAVGKEQRQPAEPPPLRFTGADELIDDDLRAIDEIAKLAFPDYETVRRGRTVSLFEAEDRFLRQ